MHWMCNIQGQGNDFVLSQKKQCLKITNNVSNIYKKYDKTNINICPTKINDRFNECMIMKIFNNSSFP